MDVNIVRIVSGTVLISNIITCNSIMKDSFYKSVITLIYVVKYHYKY